MYTLKRFCMLIVALMVISTFSCAYATSFISLDNTKIVDISSTYKITDSTLLTKTKTPYISINNNNNNNGLKPKTAKYNIQSSINTQEHIKTVNVVTSIKNYPKKAYQGQNLKYTCVITNKGTKPIYNVLVDGMSVYKELGTLKPGETKKISCTEYIWTEAQIKKEFGPDATISNTYSIGGESLHYTDYKGKKHTTYFEFLDIKLIAVKTSINRKKAILIAKLNQGAYGVCEDTIKIDSASLSSNKKFWIIKMHDKYRKWIVTVDAVTGSSRENHGKWKSFDSLKAGYITEIQSGNAAIIGTPHLIMYKGKKIWKTSVYSPLNGKPGKFMFNVYFNAYNGKSKQGSHKWLTLKQLDNEITKAFGPFRNVLRDLYPN